MIKPLAIPRGVGHLASTVVTSTVVASTVVANSVVSTASVLTLMVPTASVLTLVVSTPSVLTIVVPAASVVTLSLVTCGPCDVCPPARKVTTCSHMHSTVMYMYNFKLFADMHKRKKRLTFCDEKKKKKQSRHCLQTIQQRTGLRLSCVMVGDLSPTDDLVSVRPGAVLHLITSHNARHLRN